MSQERQPTEEELIDALESRRDLNDSLTRVLQGERQLRESSYRIAEGIAEPIGGERTNMDLLTELESDFEQDHDRREDVDTVINDAERADPITKHHLERVTDAIVARVESLHNEMEQHEIERVLDTLADDLDILFLR